MGGLGGLPAIGNVGFNAYSQHVPDNGAMFIFYAAHLAKTNYTLRDQ